MAQRTQTRGQRALLAKLCTGSPGLRHQLVTGRTSLDSEMLAMLRQGPTPATPRADFNAQPNWYTFASLTAGRSTQRHAVPQASYPANKLTHRACPGTHAPAQTEAATNMLDLQYQHCCQRLSPQLSPIHSPPTKHSTFNLK